jgi:hypothetical protein
MSNPASNDPKKKQKVTTPEIKAAPLLIVISAPGRR